MYILSLDVGLLVVFIQSFPPQSRCPDFTALIPVNLRIQSHSSLGYIDLPEDGRQSLSGCLLRKDAELLPCELLQPVHPCLREWITMTGLGRLTVPAWTHSAEAPCLAQAGEEAPCPGDTQQSIGRTRGVSGSRYRHRAISHLLKVYPDHRGSSTAVRVLSRSDHGRELVGELSLAACSWKRDALTGTSRLKNDGLVRRSLKMGVWVAPLREPMSSTWLENAPRESRSRRAVRGRLT